MLDQPVWIFAGSHTLRYACNRRGDWRSVVRTPGTTSRHVAGRANLEPRRRFYRLGFSPSVNGS